MNRTIYELCIDSKYWHLTIGKHCQLGDEVTTNLKQNENRAPIIRYRFGGTPEWKAIIDS